MATVSVEMGLTCNSASKVQAGEYFCTFAPFKVGSVVS